MTEKGIKVIIAMLLVVMTGRSILVMGKGEENCGTATEKILMCSSVPLSSISMLSCFFLAEEAVYHIICSRGGSGEDIQLPPLKMNQKDEKRMSEIRVYLNEVKKKIRPNVFLKRTMTDILEDSALIARVFFCSLFFLLFLFRIRG